MKFTYLSTDSTKGMNEYDQQAQDFLAATGSKMTVTFKAYDYYFAGEKEARNIFSINIKNKNGSWTFEFGDSISNTEKYRAATANQKKYAPTPYSILACLNLNYSEDFEDFCSEYGYDTDSRAAYKIYKAVLKESANIKRMFNEEEIEQLSEIN